jgi:iron complex transport system substrate-binding protein
VTTTETVKSSCPEKIISLLPAATEIIAALDSAYRLAGRSHECDWPSTVLHARVLTSSNIDASGTSHQIDQQVKNAGAVGLFKIDKDAIKSLSPHFIFTQDTCQVCAVDTNEVKKIANDITLCNGSKPQIISLSPNSLEELFVDIYRVGDAIDKENQAKSVVTDLKSRCEKVSARCIQLNNSNNDTPRVALIEWLDPPMSAGNWVPEMIQMAGVTDALKADAGKSHWIDWADVAAADPDFVILIPCGFELQRVLTEAKTPAVWPNLKSLRATREGNLFAVDGHHLFNRPGPRLVDSLEVLAEIIHPESFQFKATAQFAKRIEN